MRLGLATISALTGIFVLSVPSEVEGAAVVPTPISAKHATAPFVERGYRLLPDLLSGTPRWIVATYVVYPSATNFVISLATVRVYKNVYWAKRHGAITATDRFRYPAAYRVGNVVLYVKVIGHPERRQKLVSALQKLGLPLRIY
jgi:hypothetical protein